VKHETGKVRVESFVSRNQLVAEGQAGHQAALLEPEDGRKASGEEDPFDGGVGDDPLGIGNVLGRDPVQRPLRFLLHGRHRVNGIKLKRNGRPFDNVILSANTILPYQSILFGGIPDVGVYQEAVHLAVNIFNGHLREKN